MKMFKWASENILFLITIFLLVFIPLYPKLPIIGISNTWVYVRIEDFLVAGALLVWFVKALRKKAFFKTPLTIPIIVFWIVGLISTLYAVKFIFPHLANVFPHVAAFNYLRRIEYLSLFFVAYSSIKSKKMLPYIVATLAIVLLLVVFYGIGQRVFGFPAFLTMNEEFAKGIPLRLSANARIPSTFAGHYDLAAYLVLMIPLIGSMVFGFKNKIAKIAMLISATLGLILLLMTASRISFMVYLATVIVMLSLQKKKKFIIPVFIVSIFLLNSFQGISQRFGSTISEVDVVVDARTGKPIGIAKQSSQNTALNAQNSKKGKEQVLFIEDVLSTGESLPQGTGFINLPSGPTYKTATQLTYKRSHLKAGTEITEITNIEGNFVVKRALAYDMSFTTRFQGEWPRAIEALKRNFLLGSGYSSISLATDNNYLRILGEVGFFGFFSFFSIFLVFGIYVKKIFPSIKDPFAKSFIIGFSAGLFGLALNALLIDVFEASKIAFILWLLVGIILGILKLYQQTKIDIIKELKSALISSPAIIIYLLIGSFAIFSVMANNYFVGDDFTWLRWAADCKIVRYANGISSCEPVKTTLSNYFTNSDGFFYRPGTKVYFFIMYAILNFNTAGYHVFSILMHFVNSGFVFLIAYFLSKNKRLSVITSVLFLVLAAHAESIFWIASIGHLLSSAFVLSALYLFLLFKRSKDLTFLVISFVSVLLAPLFHEVGIIAPILIIVSDIIYWQKSKLIGKFYYLLYLIPVPLYLYIRYIANSHWLNGDYSYNLAHLPYNFVGNILGYLGIIFAGASSIFYYESLRSFAKNNISFSVLGILLMISLIAILIFYFRRLNKNSSKIILFSICLFVIGLAPFIGLGNISSRYVYLPSFGIILISAILIDKIYLIINKLNKGFSLVVLFTIVGIFSYFNITQLYRINNDWQKAGQITGKLVATFNEVFAKTHAATGNPVFYFANVPIKYGEAWVFPVGLKDALWFNFQTENLTVYTEKTVDIAWDHAESSASARVFEFDKNGDIEEVVRTKKTFLVPVK